jgi:hypothetical protein
MKIPRVGKFGVAAIAFCLGVGFSLFGPDILVRLMHGKAEESVTDVENGPFKILVRSQEFHHSGTVNIDICVAETSSRTFPTGKAQCFLEGSDFYKLSAKWYSQHEIEISFADGTLSQFRNYAFVFPKGSNPVHFHISMREET